MKESVPSTKQSSNLDAIVKYYDHSWFDYSFLWLNQRNLAVHFGYYDEKVRTHSNALENLNRIVADLAEIRFDDLVLDAGCGVGGSAIWLAENRRANVVGMTPVLSQLFRAKDSITKRGVADRVHVMCGDYAKTGFRDESFDVVWAVESLCHAQLKADVYQEFYRILKPGGRLVIAEYMRNGRPLSNANEELVRDWLTFWAIPDIDTAAEHEAAAVRSGFTDIINRDVTDNVSPSLRLLYGMTLFGKPLDVFLRKFGFRSHSNNVDGAQKQYLALRSKAWFYSILSARKK